MEPRVRWSAAARCPRWAVLGGLGVEPSEPDEQTRLYWIRGKALGAYVGERYREKYGHDDVVLEKPVPWALGLAHPDVFIHTEHMPVEVKSTTAPSQILDDALMQLGGYIDFDPEGNGQTGILELVHPSTYQRRAYPVILTDDLRTRVRERVSQVQEALASAGPESERLPECACDSPVECRFKGCPFTEYAWQGWEPPKAEEGDEHLAELARQFYIAKRREREAKANAEVIEGERKEIQERIAGLGLAPGTWYECGGVRIKRIAVKGRVTYDVPAAIKTGIVTEELIAPFAKNGEGYDRFDVDRVGEEAVATTADFGEEPPF